jgi:hypothetical protein
MPAGWLSHKNLSAMPRYWAAPHCPQQRLSGQYRRVVANETRFFFTALMHKGRSSGRTNTPAVTLAGCHRNDGAG